MMKGLSNRLLDWWFKPMDTLPIRVFEFSLCFTMLIYFGQHLMTPIFWLTDYGLHLSPEATNSGYIRPVPLPSASWLPLIIPSFYLMGICYLLGHYRRVLNWVFFAIVVYVQAMDQPSSFTINRMFIISFFFLAIAPQPITINGKKQTSGWIIRILQLTLLIQYGTAGVCKIYGDWASITQVGSGEQLQVLNIVWTQSQGHYKTILAAYAVNHAPLIVFTFMGISSFIFELFAPILIGWKKTRAYTLIFGVLFHLGIAVLMKDLIFFSLQMITAYIFFVPTPKIEQFLSWSSGGRWGNKTIVNDQAPTNHANEEKVDTNQP